MMTLDAMMMREPEYRAALAEHLLVTDTSFAITENLAHNVQPLRRPNGQTYEKHTRKYLWGDYWWCQDMAFDLLGQFYNLETEQVDAIAGHDDLENSNIAEWNEQVIRQVLEKVLPDMVEAFDG